MRNFICIVLFDYMYMCVPRFKSGCAILNRSIEQRAKSLAFFDVARAKTVRCTSEWGGHEQAAFDFKLKSLSI